LLSLSPDCTLIHHHRQCNSQLERQELARSTNRTKARRDTQNPGQPPLHIHLLRVTASALTPSLSRLSTPEALPWMKALGYIICCPYNWKNATDGLKEGTFCPSPPAGCPNIFKNVNGSKASPFFPSVAPGKAELEGLTFRVTCDHTRRKGTSRDRGNEKECGLGGSTRIEGSSSGENGQYDVNSAVSRIVAVAATVSSGAEP
jgi:hypothetical protein